MAHFPDLPSNPEGVAAYQPRATRGVCGQEFGVRSEVLKKRGFMISFTRIPGIKRSGRDYFFCRSDFLYTHSGMRPATKKHKNTQRYSGSETGNRKKQTLQNSPKVLAEKQLNHGGHGDSRMLMQRAGIGRSPLSHPVFGRLPAVAVFFYQ